MGGRYSEMRYFTLEDGFFVFKPNYMPKNYAMYILPLMGSMISVSALEANIETSKAREIILNADC